MKKLHIENGDIVCVVSPNDGGYIGRGIVTEIEVTKPKIEIVYDCKDCEQGVELQDGRIIVVSFGAASDKPDYFLRFDTPFNLTTKEVCDNNPNKTITLNSLIDNGLGNIVFCYHKININRPEHDINEELTKEEIHGILHEAANRGFYITEEAIMHNFKAWQGDMKSGYRDEKNGYHLFSPCGCNPLSFRVSSLEPRCADWQKTYEC